MCGHTESLHKQTFEGVLTERSHIIWSIGTLSYHTVIIKSRTADGEVKFLSNTAILMHLYKRSILFSKDKYRGVTNYGKPA